jgi:hypothetical protein
MAFFLPSVETIGTGSGFCVFGEAGGLCNHFDERRGGRAVSNSEASEYTTTLTACAPAAQDRPVVFGSQSS